MTNRMIRVNVHLQPSQLAKAKAVGKAMGLSVASMVRLALADYLKKVAR